MRLSTEKCNFYYHVNLIRVFDKPSRATELFQRQWYLIRCYFQPADIRLYLHRTTPQQRKDHDLNFRVVSG
jgi:hypothetical protein